MYLHFTRIDNYPYVAAMDSARAAKKASISEITPRLVLNPDLILGLDIDNGIDAIVLVANRALISGHDPIRLHAESIVNALRTDYEHAQLRADLLYRVSDHLHALVQVGKEALSTWYA